METIKTKVCVMGAEGLECAKLLANNGIKTVLVDDSEFSSVTSDNENLTVISGFSFVCCRVNEHLTFAIKAIDDGLVSFVIIEKGREKVRIRAEYFIDATDNIALAKNAGCPHTFNKERTHFEFVGNCVLPDDENDCEKQPNIPLDCTKTREFSNLFVIRGLHNVSSENAKMQVTDVVAQHIKGLLAV